MNSIKNDPITTEIIQSSLQAACDEMFVAMRKTAMSSIIYEVLDFGTAVTDSNGNIAASGAGIPAFIAMCDKAVQAVIKKYDSNQIKEGDVFATNDPYNGGVTHLNDVIVVMPVFSQGERIAWTANIAHWPDLGGMAPGGISADAKEIFQEGLQLPVIKMIENGNPIQSVIDIITANSRVPQYTLGDMWAAIASIRVGEKRIKDIANKYGTDIFKNSVQQFMDYGERTSLDALSSLPHGTYHGEDLLDDGRKIQVDVTINEKEFIVDLRNNPGGLLSEAISVSDSFLELGEIVSTRGRDGKDSTHHYSRPGDIINGLPLVVLINSGSASASEIVAGALKDHKRAVILGTRSFGKGSVQTVIPLPGHGAMRLTTARYYTPSGISIQAKGISPDIEVEVAKIEPIDFGIVREEDIRGALDKKQEDDKANKIADNEDNISETLSNDNETSLGDSLDVSEKRQDEIDFQLSRALDLILSLIHI